MKRPRRNNNNNSGQHLMHVCARNATTTEVIPPASLSLQTNRPARIASLNIQYVAASTPITFNFIVSAANGEEIYRSPLLLAGNLPKRFSCAMPNNTDFGLYNNGAQAVVTLNTAAPGIRCAINMKVLYKYPSNTTF
jgi:hypothetical protein